MENCEKVISLLSEYIDGELNDSYALLVRAHLEECEACKKLYEELCSIGKFFEEAQENAPAELCEGVMEKIKSEKTAAAKRKRFTKTFTGVAVAAAISLTVLASPAILMVATGGAKSECADMEAEAAPSENGESYNKHYSEIMDAVTEQVRFDADLDNGSAITDSEADASAAQKYTAYLLDGSQATVIITNNAAILNGKKYKYEILETRYVLTLDEERLVFEFFTQAPDMGESFFKQTEDKNA